MKTGIMTHQDKFKKLHVQVKRILIAENMNNSYNGNDESNDTQPVRYKIYGWVVLELFPRKHMVHVLTHSKSRNDLYSTSIIVKTLWFIIYMYMYTSRVFQTSNL